MKSIKTVFISVSLLTSCTTSSAKYTADVTVRGYPDENRNQTEREFKVEYEDSFDTKPLAISCWITGLFYGGSCWAYLAMPTPSQQKLLAKKAEENLRARVGKDAEIEFKNSNYIQTGWRYKNLSGKTELVSETSKKLPDVNATPTVAAQLPEKAKQLTSTVAAQLPEKAKQIPHINGTPTIVTQLPENQKTSEKNLGSIQPKNSANSIGKEELISVKEDSDPIQKEAITPPQPKLKDLKNPLKLVASIVETTSDKYDRESVHLKMHLQNQGASRVSAYKITVKVSTKLGTKIGQFELTSESSSIDPMQVTTDTYSWENNQFIGDEVYDRLSSVSSENLVVTLLSQTVIKVPPALSH